MTRLRLGVLPIVGAALLTLSPPAHASDCSPDFGDKALAWINGEAGTQSRELAKADYAARAFNYRLVGYERLHVRIAKLDEELEQIAGAIAALDASDRTDLALAVEREQAAERLLTRLHALAATTESVRQQNSEMLTPLDRAGFTRLALGTVGRETLMASMREIGASSESTLAGRYGVYIQVTFDENGNPMSGHAYTNTGMATTIGYALIKSGNLYAVIGGSLLILGGTVLDGIDAIDCRRKWDDQLKRLSEAARMLPSTLIGEDEQWALVEEAERTEVASFAEHGKKAEAALDAINARWKTLFGANAARAAAADAVLTVAKVEQIRRDITRGVDPAEIRRQIAVTEVAADIGRVNDAVARGRIPVITGCLSAAGVAAEEDQLDGVHFARAQFKALRAQGGFAPLHPLLDQSDAFAAAAEREVATNGPTSAGRPCPPQRDHSALFEATVTTAYAGMPVADRDLMAILTDRSGATQPAATRSSRKIFASKGVGRPQALQSMARAPLEASVAAAGLSFCVALRNGGAYSCGRSGTGAPYGAGFPDTGNPRADVLTGANDGSFASDNRRMSEKVEQASQNIALRIETTRTRVDEARHALPEWTATNTAVLGQVTVRATQADAADVAHEVAFRTATAPLLARVASELDAFRAGAADPAAVAALVHSVGGADMRLPDVPRSALPATVPAIIGVTALDAGFGAGSSSAERAILRERWKAEEALAGDAAALGLSRDLLAEAEFATASTGSAGNRLADELVRDSASLRFAAAGRVGATIAVVRPDGSIDRVALADPRQIPDNALVNLVRNFRYDQDYFRTAAVRLHGELAAGASFAGRRSEVLGTARTLSDRARSSFASGDIAEARTWLTMAIGVLDVATRFIPGVDWGRDVYEAVTGLDLFTGAELDTLDRVGAVIGVISAGVGNDLLHVRRILRRIEDLPAKESDEIYEFAQTVDRATGAELRLSDHAAKRMQERFVTHEEVLEVLDNHKPFWSLEHESYAAIGHIGDRRIAVAVKVDEREIRTVMVEKPHAPFEEMRFGVDDVEHLDDVGKLRYLPIKLDE